MLPDFEEMFDEELELEDEPDLSAGMDTEQVDVRILEAEMALHVNDLYAFREAPVREAQQLVIRSWRTGDATERLLLAHQALEISPLCADALVLLAEEEAETIEEALAYYQRALLAAETALGEGYEQEYAGQFWEKYETHPLFRALEGLANTLAEMGKSETSLRYYRQLMRFDPDDHLGARYGTLHVLMTLKDYAAAHQLIHSFPNELSAFWSYTHALVAFINQGSSKRSDNMLRWARRQNPHVPAYLMGEKKLPEEYPTSFAAGDEVEAAYYAADYYSFWWNIPGAIEWLKADKFLTTIVK